MKSDDPPYPHYEGYDLATPAEVRAMRDDIVLTLTNDSKFYAKGLKYLKAKTYVDLHAAVWTSYERPEKLRFGVGQWRLAHLNSAITDDIIRHYMHEAFNCHPGSPEGLSILEQFRAQHPECRGHLAWLESDRVNEKPKWPDPVPGGSRPADGSAWDIDTEAFEALRQAYLGDRALRLLSRQWTPFDAPVPPTPQPTKEKQMDIKQNVTLIDGVDASKFTDDQIFNFINTLEAQVENLSKTKNKPQKLVDKIKGVNDQIKVLIELVDSRV